jgi:hypothetical protein
MPMSNNKDSVKVELTCTTNASVDMSKYELSKQIENAERVGWKILRIDSKIYIGMCQICQKVITSDEERVSILADGVQKYLCISEECIEQYKQDKENGSSDNDKIKTIE